MGGRRPRQSDLRRAVSTAYYALFHALCRNCADALIGTVGANRSEPAWRQAYRSVDHGRAKDRFGNRNSMGKFPAHIQDFGNVFVKAQAQRRSADYDPAYRAVKAAVLSDIDSAEAVIGRLRSAALKDRRALAAWVTLVDRK